MTDKTQASKVSETAWSHYNAGGGERADLRHAQWLRADG
jgi:hypothetical protein